jgi:hypothetical protein
MRAVLTSIMAVVVVAALFLGNCFSCPQVLLAQHKHGCCPHSRTTPSDCTTQVLQHFVKAEKGAPAALAAVPAEILQPAPVVLQATVPAGAPSPLEYTPLLTTSLRI